MGQPTTIPPEHSMYQNASPEIYLSKHFTQRRMVPLPISLKANRDDRLRNAFTDIYQGYGKFPFEFRFVIGKIYKRHACKLCKWANFSKNANFFKKTIYKLGKW